MKLKIIAKILDGIIAANNNNIICFHENGLDDDSGNSLYNSEEGIYVGQILKEKNHKNADRYWSYTYKEWKKMNDEFALIREVGI